MSGVAGGEPGSARGCRLLAGPRGVMLPCRRMKGQSAFFAHSRRVWILFLPLPLGFLALAGVAAFLRPPQPVTALIAAASPRAWALSRAPRGSGAFPKRRALETRALQMEAVSAVIGKAGRSLDLREVLDAITRLTVEVTGVRGCSIKLLDAGTGRMSVRSLAGLDGDPPGLPRPRRRASTSSSLRDGKPVLVEGALASDFPELDGEAESLICVPLRTSRPWSARCASTARRAGRCQARCSRSSPGWGTSPCSSSRTPRSTRGSSASTRRSRGS